MSLTVKQVAAAVGVAEGTLRVWERRYKVVRPERGPNGYRRYDAGDLARLREMAALVDAGVPASHAAESVLAVPPEVSAVPGEIDHADLVRAAASLDPAALRSVVDAGFATGPFEDVVEQWFIPQLARLGEAWERGVLTVAQEHFASAGLMRALAAVFERARAEDGPVLVGLPAGSRHELALLAFAACLRRRGVDVVYLGADIPAREWLAPSWSRVPRAAVLGVHDPAAASSSQQVVDALTAVRPRLPVLVGGRSAALVRGVERLPESVTEAAAVVQRGLMTGRL